MSEQQDYIDNLKALPESELDEHFEPKASLIEEALLSNSTVESEAAGMNATSWRLDGQVEITKNHFSNNPSEARFTIAFQLIGDSDPDKSHLGDSMSGSAVMIVRGTEDIRIVDVELAPEATDETDEEPADEPTT